MKNLVLHVGPMKTSTTYLQSILCQNRVHLLENGWLYPGSSLNQQVAFYGICGPDIPWVTPELQGEHEATGHSLLAELQAAQGNIIVSAEALASLSASGIERLLYRISWPQTLVFTHRPLVKILPSAWQQHVKGGGTSTLRQFLDRIFSQLEQSDGPLYRGYALGDQIERWKRVTNAKIALVKVPTDISNRHKTWSLFQQAANLPAVKHKSDDLANPSLSLDAANLLCSFNTTMKKRGLFSQRLLNVFLKECLSKHQLGNKRIALSKQDETRANTIEQFQLEKALRLVDAVYE